MAYDLRLRAYQPGTDTPLGLLPEPLSWQASVVHNNDGALTVRYSELAEGGTIAARGLEAGLDIALEVNWSDGDPTAWVEPDNCRFLMVGDTYDKTDPALVHDLMLPSWSWLLNKVCDLNTGALQGAKSKYAGQRLFPASSDAGDVCKKMLDEHDARPGPAVPVLRDSWTTTKDSGGHNWAKKLGKNAEGRAFPAGQPLHDKLDALTKNGLCDWRTRGRGLRIYNQNSASADLSATVRLLYGEDLTDAPSKTSQADRVARILVKGDGKHKVTVKDPTVPEHYGRWEALIDSAGVKDDDDLEDAGNEALDDRNRIKGEYTRTLTMSGRWLPFRDYQVGDWVTAPGADGDERLRVMQITITRDEQNGLSGNIVLGDRFTSKDLALAGRVSAITGGTTGVIGNGTTVTVEPQDFRQPAAPTGLTLTGTLYLSPFGEHRVRLHAAWDAVTTATDGTALDVAGYELWGQPQGQTPAAQWRRITATDGLSVEWPDFMVGSQWLFTVRAIGVTTTEPGVQSATASITFGTDTVAPNQPSTPTLTSQGGALVVGWDGLDSAGGGMPADFARCEIHLSAVSGFSPTTGTRRAVFLRGGTATLSGLTYGTTYYVRLVAYDLSGNASAPSVQVSAVARAIVATDLDSGVVLPGDVAYSDHNNMVTDGSFENAAITTDRLAISPGWYAASFTVAHGTRALAYSTAGTVSQNLWLQHENLPKTLSIIPSPGTKMYVSAQSLRWGTVTGTLTAILSWLDSAGAVLSYSTVNLSLTTTYTLTEGVVTVPAGAAYARVSVKIEGTIAPSSGVVVDAVRLLQVMPTMLIEDAAITNAKIANVSANKVTTGELAAGVRVSAGPLAGNHTEMASDGFSVWLMNGAASAPWLRTDQNGLSMGFDVDALEASIRKGGHAAFQSASVQAFKLGGRTLDEILSPLPKGRVAWAGSTSQVGSITTTETQILQCRAILQPGRIYSIEVTDLVVTSTAASTRLKTVLRYALDGAAVTTSSTAARNGIEYNIPVASVALHQPGFTDTFRTGSWSAAREARFALSVVRTAGSGTLSAGGITASNLLLVIRDEGPDLAPTPGALQYTSIWNCTGMYDDGATPAVTSVGIDAIGSLQGLFSGNSIAGSGEVGVSLATIAAGSLVKAELGVYVNDSGESGDPSSFDLQFAGSTVAAATAFAGSYTRIAGYNLGVAPAFTWVDITSVWSLAHRSIYAKTWTDGSWSWSAQILNTAAHPLQLRLTYIR